MGNYANRPVASLLSIGGSLMVNNAKEGSFTAEMTSCPADGADPYYPQGTFKYIQYPKGPLRDGNVIKIEGSFIKAGKCKEISTYGSDDHDCNMCTNQLGEDTYMLLGEYTSRDPTNPGSGTVRFCANDNGKGYAAFNDEATVEILSGLHQGYDAEGVLMGYIQESDC